jgi:hypothetical protein
LRASLGWSALPSACHCSFPSTPTRLKSRLFGQVRLVAPPHAESRTILEPTHGSGALAPQRHGNNTTFTGRLPPYVIVFLVAARLWTYSVPLG